MIKIIKAKNLSELEVKVNRWVRAHYVDVINVTINTDVQGLLSSTVQVATIVYKESGI